jgi:amino acid adenylation domain-containing protein
MSNEETRMKDDGIRQTGNPGAKYDVERRYWREKLAGRPSVSGFPPDYPGTEPGGPARGILHFSLPAEVFDRLRHIANKSDQGMLIILISGIVFLLYKYSGNGDVVIGSPVLKKRFYRSGMNKLMALRVRVEAGMAFGDLLLAVKETLDGAQKNMDYYPFSDIAGLLNIPGIADGDDHGQVFKTIVLFKNLHNEDLVEEEAADMVFSFNMTEGGLGGEIHYHPVLFSQAGVDYLSQHLVNYFKSVGRQPGLMLGDIDIISQRERRQILDDFNGSEVDFPAERTVHRLIDDRAVKIPDRAAVSFEDRLLTFRLLCEDSNRLARMLEGEYGTAAGDIVGFYASRSLAMLPGLLAVLKSGACVLPIDPHYPSRRVELLLRDSGAKMVLKTAVSDPEPGFGVASAVIDRQGFQRYDGSGIGGRQSSSALAYLIYTSGSSGEPKGVMLQHRGISNHIYTKLKESEAAADDIFAHSLNIGFVASIWQNFASLFIGARLRIYARKKIGDAYGLLKSVEMDGVTVLEVIPSLLAAYLKVLEVGKGRVDLRALKVLILTGEAVNAELVNAFYRLHQVKLLNAYGQSECSDDTLHYKIPCTTGTKMVPIGRPSHNTRLYVLDEQNRLQAVGVPGELYIGGAGLSPGYLNRPELTAEKFVANPIEANERLHRTGDRVRWLPDGNMAFLGRQDLQVKIRGYRIELAEIESRILKYGGISGAVVRVFEEESGDKSLCGYIVSDSADGFEADKLREYLLGELPGYMVPSYFVLLDEIPLTGSGKVDRRALPEPRSLEVVEKSMAGGDEIEEKLIDLWSEVLRLDGGSIGPDANFFQLGGNSLRSVILTARIQKELAVNVTLTEIFEMPTIRVLASHIRGLSEERYAGIGAVEEREYYGLSSAQKRLYIVYQMDEHSTAYNIPIVREFEGAIERDKLERTFVGLIDRHESLRTSFFMLGSEPVQRIYRGSEVEFGVEYNGGVRSELAVQGIVGDFIRPFDLGRAPLLRVRLVELDGFRHILMVDIHHIVSDGTSMQILLRDFMLLHDGVGELPRLSIRYRDFAAWQDREKQSGALRGQEEFWLGQFKDGVPVLHLPTDYPRPAVQGFEGNRVGFQLTEEETAGLKFLALSEDVTMYMVLLAVFIVLLSRLSGQEDIVIGTTIAGRQHAGLEHLIGMFVNMLVLRSRPAGGIRFREFLQEVKEQSLLAFENQDYQFENLVGKVAGQRDTGRNPLFDVVFDYQGPGQNPGTEPGQEALPSSIEPYGYEVGTSRFDLVWHVIEAGNTLGLVVEYSTRLFKQETIGRFAAYFKQIISRVVENRDIVLKDIEICHGLAFLETGVQPMEFGF